MGKLDRGKGKTKRVLDVIDLYELRFLISDGDVIVVDGLYYGIRAVLGMLLFYGFDDVLSMLRVRGMISEYFL